MILHSQPIPIARLLLCSVFTLSLPPALATPADNATAGKTVFDALPPNLGEMQITPSRIATHQTTLITATLRIQYDFKPETVLLRRLDNSGQNPVATLTTFHDDGQQGDNSANDGVYTAQTNLSAVRPGIIKLGALAIFKNANEQRQLTSLWSAVQAKTKLDANQAYAVVDGAQVVFRDKNGRIIREESEQTNSEPSINARRSPQDKTELVFKQQTAITSPDQNYVGIVGSLQPANATIQSTDEEHSNIVGWEFRYQNVSGTLWTKTINNPVRRFYLPDSASLITDDGSRVLLVETGESDDEPSFTVYDSSGVVLLTEKIALYALHDAQISENGQYLLFKGLPPTPKLDYEKLIVIKVGNPAQRWTESYRAAQIVAEQIDNNTQGGFDIWLNQRKRYHFPR